MRFLTLALLLGALAPPSTIRVLAQSSQPGSQTSGPPGQDTSSAGKNPLANPLALAAVGTVAIHLVLEAFRKRPKTPARAPARAVVPEWQLERHVQHSVLPPRERFADRANGVLLTEFFREKRDEVIVSAFEACKQSLALQLNYAPGPLPLRVDVNVEALCWELVLSETQAALSPAAQSKLVALHKKFAREFPGEPFPHGVDLTPSSSPSAAGSASGNAANPADPPAAPEPQQHQQQQQGTQFRTGVGAAGTHGRSYFERLVHGRKSLGSEIGRRLGAQSFFGGGGRVHSPMAPKMFPRFPAGKP